MAFQEWLIRFILILWIFLGFSWEYDQAESELIDGFRIYHQGKIIKDNIPPDVRRVDGVYVPDGVAYGTPFTATAFKGSDESLHSEPDGLPPRTPDQIDLVPDVPSGINLE